MHVFMVRLSKLHMLGGGCYKSNRKHAARQLLHHAQAKTIGYNILVWSTLIMTQLPMIIVCYPIINLHYLECTGMIPVEPYFAMCLASRHQSQLCPTLVRQLAILTILHHMSIGGYSIAEADRPSRYCV